MIPVPVEAARSSSIAARGSEGIDGECRLNGENVRRRTVGRAGGVKDRRAHRSKPGLRLLGFLLDLPMTVVLLLLSPWLLLLVFFRGRSIGSLKQRFGCWSISLPSRDRIWIHAASVGEVRATIPLVDGFRRSRPGAEVVISTMTTGARDLAEQLLPDAQIRLFPLDFSLCVHGVLSKLRPDVVVLVELELWPNLLLACRARSIPVVIVNGRISSSGEKRLSMLGAMTRWLMRVPAQVCARGERDAERFLALGVPPERLMITGDLKHDAIVGPDPLQAREVHDKNVGFAEGGFRWVAGCTHPGEEEIALAAHRDLLLERPNSQLMVAPRHVERAESVLRLARRMGFDAALESNATSRGCCVLVVDRIGRLDDAYRIADAAFVGGSLIARGGHNILEPVAAGCVCCHGPSMENFTEMVELLREVGATEPLDGPDALAPLLQKWAADQNLRQRGRDQASRVLEQFGGAAQRCLEVLDGLLI